MKKTALTCVALTMLLVAGVASAQTDFVATLDGMQANAGMGTGSAATGSATLTLNGAGDTLTYSITLVGLDLDGAQTPMDNTDDITAMHFHFAAAGSNGGVVFGLISPNHDVDDLVIDPVAGTLTGAWEDTDANPLSAQLANLNAGNLYLNVHTTAFPPGEIRGQINPVPAAFCGDGMVDPGEDCDDGNTTSGDGCSAMCMTEVPTLGQWGAIILALVLLALGVLGAQASSRRRSV